MTDPTDIAATATWTAHASGEVRSFPAPPKNQPQQAASSHVLPVRYQDLGHLALGGMSELRRVRDTELGAELAMKILAWRYVQDDRNRALFLAEAKTTAQLQHPGIVAVQDLGELVDGRLWFTMSIVRGATLDEIVAETLGTTTGGSDGAWTQRRVLGVVQQVCDIVAYAHSEGAVHRDLKPANIMIGRFSEVRVMDWGLATLPGIDHPFAGRGTVVGTPAYMAPEQARGLICTAAADVYALGGLLYRVLTGSHPRRGNVRQVVGIAARGIVPEFPAHLDIPPALRRLCLHAMSKDPDDRPEASAMSHALSQWLDGAERRREALQQVEQARADRPAIDALMARASELHDQANALLDALTPTDSVDAKKPAWQLQDQAAALRSEATLREVTWTQRLRAALNRAPELIEAHELLADHYRVALGAAESGRDHLAIARYETLLRDHDRGRHAAYLRGDGAVSLRTSRPAHARLHRFVETDRRLIPVFEADLGRTPLVWARVGRGSWLITLHSDDGVSVEYPIFVERGEHWDGVPPDGDESEPIWIPEPGDLTEDEAVVSAGWCLVGGDPEAVDPLPRQRVWVDGFIAQRFPTTFGMWRDWLQHLVDAGDLDGVEAAWPYRRERDQYMALDHGTVRLVDPSRADHPVVAITHTAACRYAAHRGGRLLTSIEYEKAGRGVDGRLTPWGDTLEPQWSRVAGSPPLRGSTLPVYSYPTDVSVYGLRGMVGNARTWCADPWTRRGPVLDGRAMVSIEAPEGGLRVLKGAVFAGPATLQRLATRLADPPDRRQTSLGMRFVRELPITPR